MPEPAPLALFYSYADPDEQLCQELEKHLSLLQQQGTLTGWHRRNILPGANWNQISEEQFLSAQLILLLISSDFLSEAQARTEMERALQRHKAGLASVIPILLRPVDWQTAPFAQLQVLPRNGLPITQWKDRDEAFTDITKEIRLAIKQWQTPPVKPSPHPPFLCAARKDLPLLKQLKEELQSKTGAPVHLAPPSGNAEKEELREAISSTSAVILVATPATRRSPSVKQALEIAEMYERPRILFWIQGDQLPEVLPTGYRSLPSIDARGERYQTALQELLQALGRQSSQSTIHTPRPEPSPLPDPRNPYKGLQAFRTEDAPDFFGRDRLINELLEKLRPLLTTDQAETARLLTILGPSGSGKSSVIMAGLLPKLQQGALPKSEEWIYLNPIVPGKHPLEALAATLSPLFPERSLKSIREDLEDDTTRGLHLLLTTHVQQSGTHVLLVIDQFEEFFTQTTREEERQQFFNILLAAISEPHGPLIALLTLRADFYDRPLLYPELGQIIKDQQVIIFPMRMADLRKVIEQPAQLPDVQLTFEDGLVGDLLFDVLGQAGALPLLQFTLDQLFQHREERLLTLHAYQQIEGVKGALSKHAESTYQRLPTEKHQRLARALFLRLINPGTVEEDATRRRIPLSELTIVDKEETTKLAEVTNTFTQARLLTTNTIAGTSIVEVSHEALIQAWTRLQDWLHEARDDIHLQQTISEDTAEWNRYNQPTDRLYRGSQLREALKWRETNLPSLDEDRFLQAGVKERFRYRRRTFLIGLVGATGLAGIAGTGILVATLRGSSSDSSSNNSVSHISSYTYTGHSNYVLSVAWSPDGKHIASASLDNTAQVWDASNGSLLFRYTGHSSSVNSVAWSHNGKHIASASWDNTVQVWDSSTGSLQITHTGHSDSVTSVTWSPDGKHIASASWDNTVQVWDASNGSLLFRYTGHSNYVYSVAWSPDSKHIASASFDNTAQVWDASNGSLLFRYTGHSSSVNSVAWSHNGKHIASGSADKTVQVWDSSTGSLQITHTGYSDSVNSVAWSPDGKRIASASADSTVQVWDASSGSPLFRYTGHSDSVTSVTWSPDGKHIASASFDNTVQVWDAISINSSVLKYTGHSSFVNSAAWSPDGKYIASASFDNTVQVWDASNDSLLFRYTGHSSSVNSVAWSHNGKYIASGSADKTVQVWDSSTGSLQITYTGHSDSVTSVTWSPDGKNIASASSDKTVQVWDVSSGSPLFRYTGHSDSVTSVTWSPDDKHIASGSADKTVQVWDVSSGSPLFRYTGHSDSVTSVTWSPDGKHIASASFDNTVQVWDAISINSSVLKYTGHSSFVLSVAWSPDGKYIASASFDNTVQVWDASNGSPLFRDTGHSSSVNSAAWSPDGKRIASASFDNTVQVWDASAW